MKPPSKEDIGNGLKRWRENARQSKEEISRRSKNRKISKDSFDARKVTEWENAEVGLDYGRLINDILPAYGISDFDLFMDFCRPVTTEQVTLITTDNWDGGKLSSVGNNIFLEHSFLKQNYDKLRVRIDRVKLHSASTASPENLAEGRGIDDRKVFIWESPEKDKFVFVQGRGTGWKNHDGCEFVWVQKGRVFCRLAVRREGGEKGETEGPVFQEVLTEGMAVAFPSALLHEFFNASTKEAELVAAKLGGSKSARDSGQ